MKNTEIKIEGRFRDDPFLKPYETDIRQLSLSYLRKREELLSSGSEPYEKLSDFASGAAYFGLHRNEDGTIVFREWAPGASEIFLIGDFNGWNRTSHPLQRKENGVFEIVLPADTLKKDEYYKLYLKTGNGEFERIPSYALYVSQDSRTAIFSARVRFFEDHYPFENEAPELADPPFIYECHIGMATEEYRIGTYREFEEKVLPRIIRAGYNTIQFMAVMEHPYYASFGYQVGNFFAASGKYGDPDDLKHLIDTAHKHHLRVLLDVIHSHASANEMEGLNRFDGTEYQYFHEGPRGRHPAWDTRLFNYGKNEVLHFLLSNLKFYQTEYRFDGFRFDGVTSMLYKDHALGTSFGNYGMYYSPNTDTESSVYLMLANELIHELNPEAMTVAEDMSGMPGMCLPVSEGGYGFDYRLGMGDPDLWVRNLNKRDEDWNMAEIYHTLNDHRKNEKVIGYAESHDQALVGDKTLMFRLCDAEMYSMMRKDSQSMIIDRGMALHKIIRLLTAALSPGGYLNFMGNEFGHPEWIDFPREGNGWSYHYARRQWHLDDDETLRYQLLGAFDRDFLSLLSSEKVFSRKAYETWVHEDDKVLVFSRGDLLFAVNLDPVRSYTGYFLPVLKEGKYKVVLNTDHEKYGGYDRIDEQVIYRTFENEGRIGFPAYLPSRTMLVYRKEEEA